MIGEIPVIRPASKGTILQVEPIQSSLRRKPSSESLFSTLSTFEQIFALVRQQLTQNKGGRIDKRRGQVFVRYRWSFNA